MPKRKAVKTKSYPQCRKRLNAIYEDKVLKLTGAEIISRDRARY